MKKLKAGDRCQVESQGVWLPATVLAVYPGHSGAMVLPDNWADSVWAKAEQIREITVNPSSAKRGDYTTCEAVEVQRAIGRWEAGTFAHWEDETHERAYVATGQSGMSPTRFHYTNIRSPRTVSVEIHANATNLKDSPRSVKSSPFSIGRPVQHKHFPDAMSYLGVHTKDERDEYLNVILEFAKAGITGEQIKQYVDTFARIIVHGIEPADIDQYTTEHQRHHAGHPTGKLHHINHTYRNH